MLASKENLNDQLLKVMNDTGIITSFLLSRPSKITDPEQTSQFKLVNDPQSTGLMVC